MGPLHCSLTSIVLLHIRDACTSHLGPTTTANQTTTKNLNSGPKMAHVLWNSDIDVYNPQVIPLPVARTLALYLTIPDLLLFSLTSRNAHKAASEPQLWVLKLSAMGVWDQAIVVPKEKLRHIDFSALDNPLTCLDSIYKTPRIAKYQVLKVWKCLDNYYRDLQLNVPYERLKVFKSFHTPQEQAKMLTNLLRFNAIDTDAENRRFVRQKITELVEIFENAVLRELEIHYDIQDYENTRKFVEILIDLKNDQTLIDFFLQKTCFDNESIKFLNPELFDITEFFTLELKPEVEKPAIDKKLKHKSEWATSDDESDAESENELEQISESIQNLAIKEEEEPEKTYTINVARLDEFISELASVFNEEARIFDLIFPQSVPMMFKVSEELITSQLQEIVLVSSSAAKERNVYLEWAPLLYHKLTHEFLDQLNPSQNVGESYKLLIHELVDASYESYASEYINEEKLTFRLFCSKKIHEWKVDAERRENEKTQDILKHVKVETKNDFLTSFKKVFTINGSSTRDEDDETENYSEMQARAKILAENIKSLNEVFSPKLALTILNEAKISLNRLMQFREFTILAVVAELNSTTQEEFSNVLDCIGEDHLKIGFQRALKYLKEYNPKELNDLIDTSKDSAIGPLVNFFELINMADMIVQMLDFFYKEEMMNRKVVKHENSVLNPSLQLKKKLESMVDKFVADGLNTGIDVLFKEIEAVYLSNPPDKYYNPILTHTMAFVGPTEAAKRAVHILEDNIDLLVDSADKLIVEVFQQEVAERFFQLIVKVLKRSTVSVDGAVTLISDLNYYYEFILSHIKSNKRLIFPLFQALKKVGSIYLIGGEDAKAIGQLVSDLSKFNGIFNQEEIYEFVQRRQDWPQIKKHVEKVMYGLAFGDCVLV